MDRRIRGGVGRTGHAGDIGENAPTVRSRICDGLGFLGIELDEKRNLANEGVISSETSRISVRVIRTDEEWIIASTVCRVLGLTIKPKNGNGESRNGASDSASD